MWTSAFSREKAGSLLKKRFYFFTINTLISFQLIPEMSHYIQYVVNTSGTCILGSRNFVILRPKVFIF